MIWTPCSWVSQKFLYSSNSCSNDHFHFCTWTYVYVFAIDGWGIMPTTPFFSNTFVLSWSSAINSSIHPSICPSFLRLPPTKYSLFSVWNNNKLYCLQAHIIFSSETGPDWAGKQRLRRQFRLDSANRNLCGWWRQRWCKGKISNTRQQSTHIKKFLSLDKLLI